MPLDLESTLRTILESQERMITRISTFCEGAYEPPPTSYHEDYESSTSNWNQPGGYFGQEDHYDYGERYQPWNMECEYGTSYPSPSYDEEETCNMECYYGTYYDEEKTCNMLKMNLENQERIDEGMDKNFTMFHSHSWEGECEDQEDQSPQASHEEDINNMLKKLLENQEKREIEMQRQLHSLSTKIEAHGEALGSRLEEITTHVKSINNTLTQKIEEQDEESTPLYNTNTCEALINDLKSDVEGDAQIKDEFQQEVEESIHELESLLGCTIDEDLVIRHEEQGEDVAFMNHSTRSNEEKVDLVGRTFEDLCGDNLIVECMEKTRESSLDMNEFSTNEEKHVKLTSKNGTRDEESKENHMIHNEESFKEVQEGESLMDKPFGYHFGTLSTRELKVDDPRKIPFEKIRMNEFRGWFYDEYDPGDPCFCNKAFCGPVLA